jgi:hypothetical protein
MISGSVDGLPGRGALEQVIEALVIASKMLMDFSGHNDCLWFDYKLTAM